MPIEDQIEGSRWIWTCLYLFCRYGSLKVWYGYSINAVLKDSQKLTLAAIVGKDLGSLNITKDKPST